MDSLIFGIVLPEKVLFVHVCRRIAPIFLTEHSLFPPGGTENYGGREMVEQKDGFGLIRRSAIVYLEIFSTIFNTEAENLREVGGRCAQVVGV